MLLIEKQNEEKVDYDNFDFKMWFLDHSSVKYRLNYFAPKEGVELSRTDRSVCSCSTPKDKQLTTNKVILIVVIVLTAI